MTETIYSSRPQLAAPRALARAVRADVRTTLRMAWPLLRRNLWVQYRQSVLGYAWLVLPPLVLALVWTLLGRGGVVRTPNTGVPYPVYVLAGVFLWQAFVEALQCPLQQLSAARATLAKVRVPHEAFVTAGAGVVLVNAGLRLLILLAAQLALGLPVPATWPLAPLALLALVALGLGLGWGLALVGLLYTDVTQGLPLALNLWFLVTPVVYAPPAAYAAWLRLNPVTPLLGTARGWLLTGAPPAAGFGGLAAAGVLVLVGGWAAYRLAQPHIVARL